MFTFYQFNNYALGTITYRGKIVEVGVLIDSCMQSSFLTLGLHLGDSTPVPSKKLGRQAVNSRVVNECSRLFILSEFIFSFIRLKMATSK